MQNGLPPPLAAPPPFEIPPRFRIVAASSADGHGATDARTIAIAPSLAFGDGRHETTQMCLQALAVFAPRVPFRMLDIGSGSGILSIGAAKLGGSAVGVEIDEGSNVVAAENARSSGVSGRVAFGTDWPTGRFDVVAANILRGVLVALADEVVERVASAGLLVLSGLVSTDVPELMATYVPRLDGLRPEVFERGPWRALVWRLGR